MALVLTGISARNVYLSHAPLVPIHSPDTCAEILREAVPCSEEIARVTARDRYRAQLPDLSLLSGLPADRIAVRALVGRQQDRRHGDSLATRLWTGPFFDGALCRVITEDDEDLYVVSPAFHIVLRCLELPFPAALMVAMEFCGTYELRPTLETGFAKRPRALCHGEEIRRAIRHIDERRAAGSQLKGIRTARMVAQEVIDGSASPRESGLAAVLSVPKRQGGAGLGGLVLNYERELTGAAGAFLPGQRHLIYDLFWPDSRLGLEYDSSTWHTEDGARDKDGRRRLAADAMGDELLSVSPTLCRRPAIVDELVETVASKLGRPGSKGASERTRARQAKLRSICLGRHCWW